MSRWEISLRRFLRRFVLHVDSWTNVPFSDQRDLIERTAGTTACAYAPGPCGHSYAHHSPPHRFFCRRYVPGPWVPVAVPRPVSFEPTGDE